MATTMDLDNPHNAFDWAHDTYMALNEPSYPTPQDNKWPTSSALSQSAVDMPDSPFSFPPSLLHDASVERFGQITPPEDLSPADRREPRRDSRASSISVDHLRNEVSWPGSHNLQALPQVQHASPSAKRRRTSRQASTNHIHTTPASHQTPITSNPQPPKRKRGRPKSQPQMVEAFTADGYPIQVSSARQSHLEKNRVAAHKCRQRKKEYIGGLEARAREFSSKNKALKDNVAMLREEVLTLKNEVLRHAGCGFWAVDEYLARCAGDLLGMERPKNLQTSSTTRYNSQMVSPILSTMDPTKAQRATSAESLSTPQSFDDDNDYGGFDLLEDIDEEDT
ncbi:hypothetical protein B0J11DRAFT_497493 [Dendryphion nanum]|uniref:BZIP domain-containing protein n=1 Tax=Dendryphion nanum TaxID=256645 RepID=A0A9P9D5U2_9PLEO|nr:hypothetical protein B0J11DRAFT_497493 [Dendryphion nanum]